MNVLEARNLEKAYKLGRSVLVPALRGMDVMIARGEFVSIVGPSGSGKTTLLNVIGLLDHVDSGEIVIDSEPTSGLPEARRAKIRRDKIGFIFQTFNLLPHLTAEENVALPLRYADSAQARYHPVELLEKVGLGDRTAHRPDELSGGEQQRVAIARALFLDPPIILADEPTGDLDSETAAGITSILADLRDEGKTLVVVTHNEELARSAERIIHVRDGHILDDEPTARTRKRAPRQVRRPANEEERRRRRRAALAKRRREAGEAKSSPPERRSRAVRSAGDADDRQKSTRAGRSARSAAKSSARRRARSSATGQEPRLRIPPEELRPDDA